MDPLSQFRKSLPEREWKALEAWVSTFWPFQREWLLEFSPHAVCNKARQIGLSHTSSAVGNLWGAFLGELTTIISIGERESAEVLDKAKKHAELLRRLGSKMAETVAVNASELRFASGGRILALPSTGGRSFTGNVFLDEYAYQEHAAKVWDAAAAVTTLGGKLRVASTPNGVGNEFNRLWKMATANNSGWACYEISIERARADGYPLNLEKCWAIAKNDPRLFDQLFRCKFLDGEAQYIPTSAIDAASSDDLYTYEGEFFGGLDIGRTADRTELAIIRVSENGPRKFCYRESCKRTNSDALEDMVARAFKRFQLRRLCVDASGLGAFPAERMQKRHGRTRVEPVIFTLAVKEELATLLYSAFTEKTILIPRTDQAAPDCPPGTASQLRDDLCSIRRIITTAGNIRYDAPQTDDGHADSAWALALALHACSRPSAKRIELFDHRSQELDLT